MSRFWESINAQVTSLLSRVGASSAWFEPAVCALDAQTLEGWYRSTPGLGLYRRALDRIRALAPHVLGESEEALLAQAGEMAAQPTRLHHAQRRRPPLPRRGGR